MNRNDTGNSAANVPLVALLFITINSLRVRDSSNHRVYDTAKLCRKLVSAAGMTLGRNFAPPKASRQTNNTLDVCGAGYMAETLWQAKCKAADR
jgi:hypothetical protein